jgi:general secretion pathway protein G
MISKLKEKFVDAVSLEGGFTLIELMIVIAIIGILAAVAIPQLTGVRGDANISAVKAELSGIKDAMEMYYVEYNQYPASGDLAPLVSEGYMSQGGIEDSNDNEYGIPTYNGTASSVSLGSDYSYSITHTVPGTNPAEQLYISNTSEVTTTP